MTQLNQIIAVIKGVKNVADRTVTNVYHDLQKQALLTGISRTYRPKDDDGDQLPPESTKVQLDAEDALTTVRDALTRLFDVTATREYANCAAIADVVVDGETILDSVPVTYLLFLEKQLVNQRALVGRLPLLDPAERWTRDAAAGVWASEPASTVRTKKVPRNHVLSVATDKHPAQVQVYNEDVVVGYWTTRRFSGAMQATRIRELSERIDKLIAAVKFAREKANTAVVEDQYVGKRIFDYLYA